MHRLPIILIGKTVKKVARLRGGGTALPGLVAEKMDKQFVGKVLSELPRGVVVISGTNGKTTTTKIVSELLESAGLKVFTNKTGSNFVRGIAAAIVGEVDRRGRLPHDIAVLELDEAHAVQFIKNAPVNHVLVLNVMRDQLDRFGEIDYTAQLLEKVVTAATDTVILNRDDPRICALASTARGNVAVQYFGAAHALHRIFVSDDALHQSITEQPMPPHTLQSAEVELASFHDNSATFHIDGKNFQANMRLTGVYNFLNAAGALALCKNVLGSSVSDEKLVSALSRIAPAFGRGETLQINGVSVELILVKNPSGFRLALASFDPKDTEVMIAINDQYADGRDMSWLWDVDFSSLSSRGVSCVSGIRAYDMALRLHYDEVAIGTVDPNLRSALDAFMASDSAGNTKRIFCTYTAMLKLRRLLRKYTKLEIMG